VLRESPFERPFFWSHDIGTSYSHGLYYGCWVDQLPYVWSCFLYDRLEGLSIDKRM
jgi:hypothetical protein